MYKIVDDDVFYKRFDMDDFVQHGTVYNWTVIKDSDTMIEFY